LTADALVDNETPKGSLVRNRAHSRSVHPSQS